MICHKEKLVAIEELMELMKSEDYSQCLVPNLSIGSFEYLKVS